MSKRKCLVYAKKDTNMFLDVKLLDIDNANTSRINISTFIIYI